MYNRANCFKILLSVSEVRYLSSLNKTISGAFYPVKLIMAEVDVHTVRHQVHFHLIAMRVRRALSLYIR